MSSQRDAAGVRANNKDAEEIDQEGDSGEYDDEVDAERDMIRENAMQQEDIGASRTAKALNGMGSGGSMMKNITGALLAKAFLPSGAEVKQCLVYTDLAIKMQMIVFDLSSSLWWSTMAELFIFFFALFVFFIDASRMGFIWLFLPHVIRAVLGLLIIKKMPTTHEMVSKIQIQPGEKIPFSKINKFVVQGATDSVNNFQQQAGKFMLLYAILTVVALVLDFIVIFIGIGHLSNDGGAFSMVFVFLLGLMYFIVALFFIGWVISVRMRLPAYARTEVTMGLLGIFKKLTLALETKNVEVNGQQAKPKPTTTPVSGPAKPTASGQPRARN